MKFVKWQDSSIGKYIEYKIRVFFQEGPGSQSPTYYQRSSMAFDEEPTSIYSWTIYKRYSNFVDLHESLAPIFADLGIPAPSLPPKIELNNDIERNQNLTDRKRGLQKYLRHAMEALADSMPPHLLIFLGLHEQSGLGFQSVQQV